MSILKRGDITIFEIKNFITISTIKSICTSKIHFFLKLATALIVKGWDAPAEEPLPWHATLFSHVDGVWKFFCGGTLIAESIVLTAAHCIWKTAPDTIRVSIVQNLVFHFIQAS